MATHHYQRGTTPTDFRLCSQLWPPEKACCEILPGSCDSHVLSHAVGRLITNQSRRVPGDPSWYLDSTRSTSLQMSSFHLRGYDSTGQHFVAEQAVALPIDACRPKVFHFLRQTEMQCAVRSIGCLSAPAERSLTWHLPWISFSRGQRVRAKSGVVVIDMDNFRSRMRPEDRAISSG